MGVHVLAILNAPPTSLPVYTIPLGHPSAPGPSILLLRVALQTNINLERYGTSIKNSYDIQAGEVGIFYLVFIQRITKAVKSTDFKIICDLTSWTISHK